MEEEKPVARPHVHVVQQLLVRLVIGIGEDGAGSAGGPRLALIRSSCTATRLLLPCC